MARQLGRPVIERHTAPSNLTARRAAVFPCGAEARIAEDHSGDGWIVGSVRHVDDSLAGEDYQE